MLKKIGKWFDKLCGENLNQDLRQDKSAMAQFITDQPDVPYKRTVSYSQLNNDEIFTCLRNNPSNVVHVERKTNLDTHVEITQHYYMWDEKIIHFIVTSDNKVFYNGNEIHRRLFTSEHFTHRDILEISVLKYGEDIPKASKEMLSKLKLKPYALPHYLDDLYLENIEDDHANFLEGVSGKRVKYSYLFLDLYNLLEVGTKKSTHVYDRYFITDYDKVDRRLIPYTDARRWVIIDELENNTGEWVIRWVPKSIGCGKIRYFGMTFNFDAADLGGVTFSVDQLVVDTINRLVIKLNDELKSKVNSNSTDERADIYFNFSNLTVKYKSIDVSLTGYMQHQSKNVFQDANPYLTRSTCSSYSSKRSFVIRDAINTVL